MKKIYIFLSIGFLLFFFSIQCGAASWRYEWKDSIVYIPVGESLENYKYKPQATLYKDNILLTDAQITYLIDGDWMYYLQDVDTSKVGEYEVWYKAYENGKYRPGTCLGYKCKVKFVVQDTIPPTIEIYNPTMKIRRKSEFNPVDNVVVRDNYDSQCEITYSTNLVKDIPGTYSVTVNAVDSSKNASTKTYSVEVYEECKPVLIYKNEGSVLNIPLNDSFDISKYFEAFDEIDGDLTKYIEYPVIDNRTISEKEYTIRVKNFADLETTKTILIRVVDDKEPEIVLSQETVILDYSLNFSSYDFLMYVNQVVDNAPIDYTKLTYRHNLKNEVGNYTVWYSYQDSSYTTTKALEVRLLSTKKPNILVENVSFVLGEEVDLTEFVHVEDPSDPLVEESMEIDDSAVDYSLPGNYTAEVYVMNSSGLSNTAKIKITINEPGWIEVGNSSDAQGLVQKEEKKSYKEYGFLLIIGILIGLLVIQSIRIKKHKSI